MKIQLNHCNKIICYLLTGWQHTLPRACRLAKLSNWVRRALVRESTKYLMVTLTELFCGDGRTFQEAFKVEWPDISHSSVKGTRQPAWSLPKGARP